jgi:hypothetical protein
MCVATDFVMIGLDMIEDESRRQEIRLRFGRSGREVSPEQLAQFAGNAIELAGGSVRCMLAGIHLASRE